MQDLPPMLFACTAIIALPLTLARWRGMLSRQIIPRLCKMLSVSRKNSARVMGVTPAGEWLWKRASCTG